MWSLRSNVGITVTSSKTLELMSALQAREALSNLSLSFLCYTFATHYYFEIKIVLVMVMVMEDYGDDDGGVDGDIVNE